MDREHRKLYDVHLQKERSNVLDLLAGGGLNKNRFQILRALTKMRQLCLHPELIDAKHSKIPASKLMVLRDQLETIVEENHKVLIFSQFTSFLSYAKDLCDELKIPHLYLDGATVNRGKLVSQFQTDSGPPVFLISLKAGGVGLNLTQADYCIILDPWWNPAVENQAIDRTHRIGQMKHVFVYKLITKDTIEEKVLQLQEKKAKLFRSVMEDGGDFGELVTEKEIRSLFE